MIRRIDARYGGIIAIAFVLALSLIAHTAKPPHNPNDAGWTITTYPWPVHGNGGWEIVKLSEVPVD